MSLETLQREKVAALSLCSSFREVLHLQLLRARLKESRTHGSRTQARKQKDLLSFTAPQFNLISNKNDFVSSPAARGGFVAVDVQKSYMFFSSVRREERHEKGGSGGNVRARFLDTSCRVARSVIKSGTPNARNEVALCEAVGKVT